MSRRPVFTVALAAAGWLVLAWLATHRSHSPEVLGRYSPEYTAFLAMALIAVLGLTALAVARARYPALVRAVGAGRTALGVLVATVVGLLISEGLVRAFDLLGASMFEEVTRYVMDLEADDEIVYRHRPGVDTVYQGVRFTTNEAGLRDRPLDAGDPAAIRVLVLGDSVTLGWGVAVEQTYPRRLEAELESRLGRPVRTLNAGVSGYNTSQELGLMRRLLDAWRPDLVIVLYVQNDIEPEARDMVDLRRRWHDPPGASAWLLRWSWLYRLVHFVVPNLLGRSEAIPADRTGWNRSLAALEAMAALGRSRGVPLAFFLYRMLPDERTEALRRDIEAIAGREGVPFVDTLPWFRGAVIRRLVNSFVDTHPNARGHGILARGMAESLAGLGLACAPPGAPPPAGSRCRLSGARGALPAAASRAEGDAR